MDTNVLIVGAGPTGLMLANQLARRGEKALIIDRHFGPAQQTRAMAVQARTLEIYSKMGIVVKDRKIVDQIAEQKYKAILERSKSEDFAQQQKDAYKNATVVLIVSKAGASNVAAA